MPGKEIKEALERFQKGIPVILRGMEEGKVEVVVACVGASEEDIKIIVKVPKELSIAAEGIKEISFRPSFNQLKTQFGE